MDDIEKLKAENSDLRTKVERLLRILENLSNGYVKKER